MPYTNQPEAIRAVREQLQQLVSRYLASSGALPEANAEINDLSRRAVHVLHHHYQAAWLGRINRNGREKQLPMLVRWPHEDVSLHNFSYDFVIPTRDGVLIDMLKRREETPYTTTRADAALLDPIMRRVEDLGGVWLVWT